MSAQASFTLKWYMSVEAISFLSNPILFLRIQFYFWWCDFIFDDAISFMSMRFYFCQCDSIFDDAISLLRMWFHFWECYFIFDDAISFMSKRFFFFVNATAIFCQSMWTQVCWFNFISFSATSFLSMLFMSIDEIKLFNVSSTRPMWFQMAQRFCGLHNKVVST
jgi:hypothetical protein